MKILITGGSGDLGSVLIPDLILNYEVVNLDLRIPVVTMGEFIHGSILDRKLLEKAFVDVDYLIHIAAWHGIHEFRGEKSAFDFWDLNVTGTFSVFEFAVQSRVKGIVNISSTSVDEWPGIYGASKVMNEELARTYVAREQMRIVTLRPRAFIPYWNQTVYQDYIEWAKWFWPGAVHINDVAQAVNNSLELLRSGKELPQNITLVIDGAYDYPAEILEDWDADGPGSSFSSIYPEYIGLAKQYGFDIQARPQVLNNEPAKKWINYHPLYSLRNMFQELEKYGDKGPPSPFSVDQISD